jgi:hypothetical protein
MSIETGLGLTYRTDFPIPGINQSSQPFRDNFLTIKRAVENLQAATAQTGSPLVLQTSVGIDGSVLHSITYPTSGFPLPTGDITPMADGRIRYNPSIKKVQVTTDGEWVPVGGDNTVAFSGDATGSGLTGTTIPLTLSASGVVPGTYTQVVVDAKGRVTSGDTFSGGGGPSSLVVIGDVEGSGTGTVSLNLIDVGSAGTYAVVVTDENGRVISGIPDFEYRDAIQFACSDETTVLTTSTNQFRMRFPYSFTVTGARATLNGESLTGEFKIDVSITRPNGGIAATMFEDGLVIDEGLRSSRSSLVQPVLVDRFANPLVELDVLDDSLLSVDIVNAGDGAFGLKLIIYGYKNPSIVDLDLE